MWRTRFFALNSGRFGIRSAYRMWVASNSIVGEIGRPDSSKSNSLREIAHNWLKNTIFRIRLEGGMLDTVASTHVHARWVTQMRRTLSTTYKERSSVG